jgi:hypothetical protein
MFQYVKRSEEAGSTAKEDKKILPPILKQRAWFSVLMKVVFI